MNQHQSDQSSPPAAMTPSSSPSSIPTISQPGHVSPTMTAMNSSLTHQCVHPPSTDQVPPTSSPSQPPLTTPTTQSSNTAGLNASTDRQHGHPPSTDQVTPAASPSQPPLTAPTTQGSQIAVNPNTSTEQQHVYASTPSSGQTMATLPQPSPNSRENSYTNQRGSVVDQRCGQTLATTSPPQPPTNSSPVSQHSSGSRTVQQQPDPSLTGQITTMTISPQPPPNSSPSPSQSPTCTSQSSHTAYPGTTTVQQYCHPSPLLSQVTTTTSSPQSSSRFTNQHESYNVDPSLPPSVGQSMTTVSSSSQPPLVSMQHVASQHSYAASPDASLVQQRGHHPPPPSAPATAPATAPHIAPSLPPQPQATQHHPNFTHFSTSQRAYTNPSGTAMAFHQHGHPTPPPPPDWQIRTNAPSRLPPTSFQHTTIPPYPNSRASTSQHHPGYTTSHPYSILPHHATHPLHSSSAGYASPSTNFSLETARGSLASSTPPPSSGYQHSMGGSSYYSSHYHPSGVYGQQPAFGPILSGGTHRPTRNGKVFILYCKDHQFPPTFSDDVLDLADILNHCGGFKCTIDHYVDVPPPNWNLWTQQKIEESQYVLLVCSPTLAQVLREPAHYMLEMEKGKYYASNIVNYVQSPKFIAVYLNNYVPRGYSLEWVPTQLHTSAVYGLNISELRSVLMVAEDSSRHVLDQKLGVALSEERFRNIAKLVNHLRGETITSPPVPPEHPIPVPPTGLGATPRYPPTLTTTQHEYIPSSTFEKIAERMPRDWFILGVKLGMKSTQLQKLRTKHSFNHVPAALEMFSLWQQTKGTSATRKALKDVLEKMEYGRLAYELFPDVKS